MTTEPLAQALLAMREAHRGLTGTLADIGHFAPGEGATDDQRRAYLLIIQPIFPAVQQAFANAAAEIGRQLDAYRSNLN